MSLRGLCPAHRVPPGLGQLGDPHHHSCTPLTRCACSWWNWSPMWRSRAPMACSRLGGLPRRDPLASGRTLCRGSVGGSCCPTPGCVAGHRLLPAEEEEEGFSPKLARAAPPWRLQERGGPPCSLGNSCTERDHFRTSCGRPSLPPHLEGRPAQAHRAVPPTVCASLSS